MGQFRRDDALEAPFYELDQIDGENSIESFDRLTFARETVHRLLPHVRVAVTTGTRQVQVFSGRLWGEPRATRWVMVSVPKGASRRAIVHAVASLGGEAPPYFYDAFLGPSST